MNKKRALNFEKGLPVLASLVSIMLGLFFGFIVMLVSNPSQVLVGFKTILTGGFYGGARGFGQVLYYAAPLLMTGLSVGFAFKTGLFNIGASGQFIMGAFGAVYVGVKWTFLPEGVHWIAATLAAMLLGGLCALLPGVLKAYLNVNEVVSCIMMNYIAIYLVNQLVLKTVYDKLKNQSLPVSRSAQLPKMGLDVLFPGSSANAGIIIAIAIAVVIHIVLNKTTFGYELKACGFNAHASKYSGINIKLNIVSSMVISGVLAGLGGAILYLAETGKHIVVQDVIPAEGFSGISIALLALSNPLGIIFVAIFIAYITVGGFQLQMFNYPTQVVDMIISAIICFSAFAMAIRILVSYIKKRRDMAKMEEGAKSK